MGGVEHHVHQISRRLVQRDVDVTVLTTDTQGQWPAREEMEGIHVRRVKAWPAERDYYFAPATVDILTHGRWDIVHVHSVQTLVAPMAMWAAGRAHIPYVLTFHSGGHSSRLRKSVRGLQWQILRPLLARAAKLITTNRFEIGYFAQRLRLPLEHFHYGPNGGDIPTGQPFAAATPDPSFIISPGRLERYKGHHRVIAAMPHILEKRPDARLLVLGSGPYEPELIKLTKKLGVADHVEIHGLPMTERQAMAETLSRAALVVLMSEWESPSIAALEAIMLRRSLLVADTSGLGELAGQGLARAIPLHSSTKEIAVAILDQLEHPHIAPPITLPTWDDCANDLYDLYQEIARAHSTTERMKELSDVGSALMNS